MDDEFDLHRFLSAQDAGRSYDSALAELRDGRKRGHWMWYVFPQLAGLGRSEMARYYAISGLPEARAYLEHPGLGQRLLACAGVLRDLPGTDPVEVLGAVDAQKLRSCLTLFAHADPDQPVFTDVLDKFFAGELDEATIRLL